MYKTRLYCFVGSSLFPRFLLVLTAIECPLSFLFARWSYATTNTPRLLFDPLRSRICFMFPLWGLVGLVGAFFVLVCGKCTSFFKKCVVGHLSASVQFRYDTDARALSGSHIVPLLSVSVQKLDLNFFRGFFSVMKRFEFFLSLLHPRFHSFFLLHI